MITKLDWQAVHQAMTAKECRMLGDPPMAETMLAYWSGDLSGESAARVQSWLVCNPDAARALLQPFPEDDARPGDVDYLSEAELAKHWASLQKRIQGGPAAPKNDGRVLQFRPVWMALAASLILVFGGLFIETKLDLRQPRVLATQILWPDGRRGAEHATVLTAQGERVLLIMSTGAAGFERYRVEISDGNEVRWKSAILEPPNEDSLSIEVSRGFLKAGRYRIVVYGIDGTAESRLDTFTLLVPKR
jgi:hypothetical protein